jgi:aryl-alcohol dehydrogenase-like predicted oxidoreductase
MTARKRKIGPFAVNPIGLGCMSLSHAYGTPPSDDYGERLLNQALDAGYDFFDTATIYGQGHNETLIGRALKGRRDEFVLASKTGIFVDDGGRRIDCRPETISASIDASLQRFGFDHIDLYYLHRRDFDTPIEESVGALKRAVEAGKIRAIGLSEMSADTLRRAHKVHPIAALQTEYSLWTRNPEIAVLDACRELGTTFVAFSPVARGFLAGGVSDPSQLGDRDIRKAMPRFMEPNFSRNKSLLDAFLAIADREGHTPAQLSLAWLLHKDDTLVPIPGTASIEHMEENVAAGAIKLTVGLIDELDALINRETVHGPRYSVSMQETIETEEFA